MTALILLVLNLGASLLQRKLRGRVEFTNSVWLAGFITSTLESDFSVHTGEAIH